MRWGLLCFALSACHAQQELSPELMLLTRIKVKVAENLNRLPNYTCEETIERSQRVMPARKFEMLDTVHLEVALVEHHELYGWPGANRIEESELSNLVGGTIGNGDFGLLARSIFLSDGSFFTRAGGEEMDGRKTIRYDYRVPLLSSGYRIRVPPNEAVVAYHGSFWVEAGTLDLVRLDLTADNIPLQLGLRSSSKTLRYQATAIGASTFLLPSGAELLMVDLNGTEHRNRTSFHACRQYMGESVLSFADPPPDAPVAATHQVTEVQLPVEFLADIALATPIDSNTSAVGDPIEGTLVRPMKERGRIIAPKGALLKGRITRLQRQKNSYAFALAFYTLEFPGSRASLRGRENDLTISVPGHSPCGPSTYAACDPAESSRQALEIQGGHLRLSRGFQIHMHSVLLKSEKQ